MSFNLAIFDLGVHLLSAMSDAIFDTLSAMVPEFGYRLQDVFVMVNGHTDSILQIAKDILSSCLPINIMDYMA